MNESGKDGFWAHFHKGADILIVQAFDLGHKKNRFQYLFAQDRSDGCDIPGVGLGGVVCENRYVGGFDSAII